MLRMFNNHSQLIKDLELAIEKVSRRTGGYSGELPSAQEFRTRLEVCLQRLKEGDRSVLQELWAHFAPTSAWDDFVSEIDLGERIYQRIERELKRT